MACVPPSLPPQILECGVAVLGCCLGKADGGRAASSASIAHRRVV